MRTALMLVSFGAMVVGIVTVLTGTGTPFWMLTISTIEPDTVPVSSIVPVGNDAAVPFAGMVKLTVLELFENITAGSSVGTTLLDINVSVREPDTGFGCGDETDKATGTCCAGCMVSGTLVRENVGLIILRVNAWVATCWDPLPVTRIVKLKMPAAVGVPLIKPPVDSVRPSGNAPEVRDHVKGVVPPVADNVCEYGIPILPVGRGDVGVIARSIVMANGFVIVRDALSRT